MLWVYMGKQAQPPRFPDYEFTGLGPDRVQPIRGIIRTNWLQGLEALLDSAHVGFLHSANLNSAAGRAIFKAESDYMLNDGAPVFEFVDQPYGFREGAIRDEAISAMPVSARSRCRCSLSSRPRRPARVSSAARFSSTTRPPRNGISATIPTRP